VWLAAGHSSVVQAEQGPKSGLSEEWPVEKVLQTFKERRLERNESAFKRF
jgi:hypothetical protein